MGENNNSFRAGTRMAISPFPTDEDLEEFSRDMYTFIQQFFSDWTVLKHIENVYNEIDHWKFTNVSLDDGEAEAGGFDSGSTHWALESTVLKETRDSERNLTKNSTVVSPHKNSKGLERSSTMPFLVQDVKRNKNDNLCMIYSIYGKLHDKPLGGPEKRCSTNKQKQAILANMLIGILQDERFMNTFDSTWFFRVRLGRAGDEQYIDLRNDDGDKLAGFTGAEFIQKMLRILDDWKVYGYEYYIGKGHPRKQTKKMVVPIMTVKTRSSRRLSFSDYVT